MENDNQKKNPIVKLLAYGVHNEGLVKGHFGSYESYTYAHIRKALYITCVCDIKINPWSYLYYVRKCLDTFENWNVPYNMNIAEYWLSTRTGRENFFLDSHPTGKIYLQKHFIPPPPSLISFVESLGYQVVLLLLLYHPYIWIRTLRCVPGARIPRCKLYFGMRAWYVQS